MPSKKGDGFGHGAMLDYLSPFLISQLLATVSFGFGLASYQFKGRRKILLCMVGSNFFNASHFFLLGRPGPAALLLVTGIRYSVATVTTNRKVMVLFLLVTTGVFLGSATNLLSLLPCIGTLIATFGSFQTDDRRLRLILMVGNAMWTVHNILAGTPVGAIMEGSFLTSNIVGYWHYYYNKGGAQRLVRDDE